MGDFHRPYISLFATTLREYCTKGEVKEDFLRGFTHKKAGGVSTPSPAKFGL